MTTPSASAPSRGSQANQMLMAAAAAGAAVSLSLAVYTRVHEPTGKPIATFGFPDVITMKAWFGTLAVGLALLQVVTALAMWGRLPGVTSAPGWLTPLHRWSGTAAFVVSLPVAYHCLWALGIQTTTPRVMIHSLFGTAFYGALTTKLLVLRIKSLPSWALPFLGALVVTAFVLVWWTSSLWYFRTTGTGL